MYLDKDYEPRLMHMKDGTFGLWMSKYYVEIYSDQQEAIDAFARAFILWAFYTTFKKK